MLDPWNNSVIKHQWAVPPCVPSVCQQSDGRTQCSCQHETLPDWSLSFSKTEWTVNPPGTLGIAAGIVVLGLVKFVNGNMFSVTRRENSKPLTAQRGSGECSTEDINTEGADLLQLAHSMALSQTHTQLTESLQPRHFSKEQKTWPDFIGHSFRYTCRNMHTSVQARGIWFDTHFGLNLPWAFWGEIYVCLNFTCLAVRLIKYK